MFIFCFILKRNINILNEAKKVVAILGYAFLDPVTNNRSRKLPKPLYNHQTHKTSAVEPSAYCLTANNREHKYNQ